MDILGLHLTVAHLVLFLMYVLGVAIALTYSLDALQKAGVIKDGDTGKWNKALSVLINVAAFALAQLGAGNAVDSVAKAALEAAAFLVSSGSIAALAWAWHQLDKLLDPPKEEGQPLPPQG